MILFFDVETNGLPKRGAKPGNPNDYPFVTQLAYLLCDDTEVILEEYCSLIKPKGWTIPDEPFFRNNNMSNKRCEEEGVHIELALNKITQSIQESEVVVAHNLEFDRLVLNAEFIRNGIVPNKKPKKFVCTMKSTTDLLQIPHTNGLGFKWPRLDELYFHLFEESFDGAHDALVDVKAMAKCYFKLVEAGLI